jgi:hypothetical protein
MIIVILAVGLILIAAAIRNTQGQLFAALGSDLPAYVIWAAAIVAVGALGFVPGLKGPSRVLLALVIVVIILNNYQAILAGFAAVSAPRAAAGGPTGAATIAPPGAAPAVSPTTGTGGVNTLVGASPTAIALGSQAGSALHSAIAGIDLSGVDFGTIFGGQSQ